MTPLHRKTEIILTILPPYRTILSSERSTLYGTKKTLLDPDRLKLIGDLRTLMTPYCSQKDQSSTEPYCSQNVQNSMEPYCPQKY